MSVQLKIKSKHLALEPNIIRKEERILLNRMKKSPCFGLNYWDHRHNFDSITKQKYGNLEYRYNSLFSHRVQDVRREARATFLARAFLKGKPYISVERNVRDLQLQKQILKRAAKIAEKYRNRVTHQEKFTEEDLLNWASENT